MLVSARVNEITVLVNNLATASSKLAEPTGGNHCTFDECWQEPNIKIISPSTLLTSFFLITQHLNHILIVYIYCIYIYDSGAYMEKNILRTSVHSPITYGIGFSLCVMEDGSRATDIGQIQDAAPLLGDFCREKTWRIILFPQDPWDERYIYLHEWLKFMVFM